MEPKNSVDIFNYSDHCLYLKEALDERLAQNKYLSLRNFSQKTGLKSPATLSMIVNGKRNLTVSVAEKLADGFNLTGRRRKYLLQLAKFSSARSEEEKLLAWTRMVELRSISEESRLELRQYRFLSTWYYPVLYAMIGVDNFQADEVWIVDKLGKGVSEVEVRRAIKDLIALDLVQLKNGKLEQIHGNLTTADDVRNIAVEQYHKNMIEMAREALDLPKGVREMNGLTISLPKEQLAEVKERIRKFRHELNEYIGQFSDAETIYQLNVQFFPLTKDLK